MDNGHPFIALSNCSNQLGNYDNQLGQMPAFVGTLKSKIPGFSAVPDIAFLGIISVVGLFAVSFVIPALGKSRKKLLKF